MESSLKKKKEKKEKANKRLVGIFQACCAPSATLLFLKRSFKSDESMYQHIVNEGCLEFTYINEICNGRKKTKKA